MDKSQFDDNFDYDKTEIKGNGIDDIQQFKNVDFRKTIKII